MVTLYSTHCPKCNVLQAKLDGAGIEYDMVTDENVMIEKGFMTSPMLEVDGEVMNFEKAIDWVREQGGVGICRYN